VIAMAEPTRWLTDEEQATWRSYILSTQLLDETLDRQLLRDSNMPHTYFAILVALSDVPGRRMRMNDLARLLRFSQSRMTHAMKSLEGKGWVRREQCPTDRRGQEAVLNDEGMRALEAAAPGHVAEVRAHVFDLLSPEQVANLRDICETLLTGLDPPECPESDPVGDYSP
jgi:DNA-binding MarR family transcriptional regulator